MSRLTAFLVKSSSILNVFVKTNRTPFICNKVYIPRRCYIRSFQKENEANKISPMGWFLLLVPATTFGLGCWQVKRKAWKENLIKDLQEKITAEPGHLPDNLEDLQQMEYRRVKVRGHYQSGKELYIGPRTLIRPDGAEGVAGLFSKRDNSSGYLVITPFKLADREETILINRGWIPRKLMKLRTYRQEDPDKLVEIMGVVRLNELRPQFTPEHKGDIYLYRDISRMCAETGTNPVFLDACYDESSRSGPIGGQTRVTMRNEHLSYIITWFSLSAATAAMWYRQVVKGKGF